MTYKDITCAHSDIKVFPSFCNYMTDKINFNNLKVSRSNSIMRKFHKEPFIVVEKV